MSDYEEWRISFQDSEQAARAAYEQIKSLSHSLKQTRGELYLARIALPAGQAIMLSGNPILTITRYGETPDINTLDELTEQFQLIPLDGAPGTE